MTWFTPFRAVLLAVFLSVVLTLDVAWAATHHRTQIEPCALVLTQSGPVCRP